MRIWKASAVDRRFGNTTYYRNKMNFRKCFVSQKEKSSQTKQNKTNLEFRCNVALHITLIHLSCVHCIEIRIFFYLLVSIFLAALFFINIEILNLANWQPIFKTFDSKLILNSRIRFNRIVFICVIGVPHEYQLWVYIFAKTISSMHENINA